jgi:hypothetical protein
VATYFYLFSHLLCCCSILDNIYFYSKEKWDQSGANDALARMSASIPQGTKEYISLTSSQLFDRQHVRSLTVYFGVGEEKPFYLEKTPALLLTRLKHNFSFFYLNYLMVTVLLFCLTLMIHPTSLIGIGLLAFACIYVVRQSQSGSLRFRGKEKKWSCFQTSYHHLYYLFTHWDHLSACFLRLLGITISQNHATIGMGIISMFVLLYLLSEIFWLTLFSSGFLVTVHAGLRDASMHQDGEDKVTMVGEVGEDSAFLGANSNPV